jgi:hypothetical protein
MEAEMIAATPHDPLAGAVRQIALPPDARALSTLTRIDYTDAFLVDGDITAGDTALQWARAVVEQTPLKVRVKLVSGWSALGLVLGPPWSGRRVLGWQIRVNAPDVLLLGAGSVLGIAGELLFTRRPEGMLFATLTRQRGPLARAVWARTVPTHQRVVRSLLEHAAARAAAG